MTTVLLLILAAIGKACADTHTFRYGGSVFAKWANNDNTAWGAFWQLWSGPDSWRNKDTFPHPIGRLLASTVFVFLQDAWHFFNFIFLTSLQLAIALEVEPILPDYPIWNVILLVMIMKFVLGVFFEFFWSDVLIWKHGRARLEYKDQWRTALLAAYPDLALWINWILVGTPFVVLTTLHQFNFVSDLNVVLGVIASGVGVVWMLIRSTKR